MIDLIILHYKHISNHHTVPHKYTQSLFIKGKVSNFLKIKGKGTALSDNRMPRLGQCGGSHRIGENHYFTIILVMTGLGRISNRC
jgi:hypothetical protein